MTREAIVTHTTEEITPEMAELFLEANNLNRPIRLRRVSELAGDMLAGRWKENGEAGVTFDWNGDIAGGQHTLSAVVQSGVSIRCRVTRGVEPAARATMNDASKQRFSDDLHVSGVMNSAHSEALLRKILVWEKAAADHDGAGGLTAWGSARFSRSELAEAWPQYSEGITLAVRACHRWHDSWGLVGNYGALEFTFWLLTVRQDSKPGTVTEYFDLLAYGSQDQDDQVLTRIRMKLRKKPNTAPYQVFWLCRGWNAWTRNEKLAKLQLPPGGLPLTYPRLQRTR